MQHLVKLLFPILFIAPFCVSSPKATESLKFPSEIWTGRRINSSDIYTDIIIHIYRELGCKTQFLELPARRSLLNFNSGKFDGLMIGLKDKKKMLIRKFLPTKEPVLGIKSYI